jgi:hypothetical protein
MLLLKVNILFLFQYTLLEFQNKNIPDDSNGRDVAGKMEASLRELFSRLDLKRISCPGKLFLDEKPVGG